MRGGNGWWPWVVAGTVMVGLVALLVVTVLPLGGREGLQASANTAQLTALLIAAGAAALGATTWARRITRPAAAVPTTDVLTHAKDVLAVAVERQWKDEARLRSLDDPDPIPVRWRTPAQPGTSALMDHPANVGSATDPEGVCWTASSADIAALADRFRSTRRRRLVILGGPGTGKTTLAMQLLLRLLDTREPAEPIPVLLPLADWDTRRFPRLHEWLADRLTRDYPALRSPDLGVEVVRSLSGRGHILPVLDGLDELPTPARAKVISALNHSLGGDDQLVLTSRTTEFSAAVTQAGNVVTSAAVLESLPLAPADAADYLTRWLPPRPSSGWQQVLADLRTTPPAGPGRPGTALAGVAATPLGLWLLRSVYSAPGADPAELADPDRFPDPTALRGHLFEQLIPALIATRPPSDDPAGPFRPRRHHDPAQVRRRLSYLAHHLTRQPAMTGDDSGPGTHDFAWWRLAATTPAAIRATALTLTLLVTLVAVLTAGLTFGFTGGLVLGILYGIGASLRIGLAARSWARDAPGYADLRVRGRSAELMRELAFGIGAVFVYGPLVGPVYGLAAKYVLGITNWLTLVVAAVLTSGVMGGSVRGFVAWAETPTQVHHTTTPMGNWRADRTLSLVRISTNVLVGAVVLGVTFGVTFGSAGGLAGGLVGPVVGFPGGLLSGHHRAWSACLVSTWRLAWAGHLPRRLMPFLDDCHRLGLLRAVGPIYQFRHAELQDHLAATYRSREKSAGR